tara:strand:- start:37 stop:267 length:231 start_codon:yes stop_codon:yes gene_type:complete
MSYKKSPPRENSVSTSEILRLAAIAEKHPGLFTPCPERDKLVNLGKARRILDGEGLPLDEIERARKVIRDHQSYMD